MIATYLVNLYLFFEITLLLDEINELKKEIQKLREEPSQDSSNFLLENILHYSEDIDKILHYRYISLTENKN